MSSLKLVQFFNLLVFSVSGILAQAFYDYESLNPVKELQRISPINRGHSTIPDISRNDELIKELLVQCTTSGLFITVEFQGPFNGVVYSKGYYTDPACRFLTRSEGLTNHTFEIKRNDCGTNADDFSRKISNVLIFQRDELVQEASDVVKQVSCKYGGRGGQLGSAQTTQIQKTKVAFNFASVKMMDVAHRPLTLQDKNALKSWMEIRKGKFPNTRDVPGYVHLGEELSTIVYLKDTSRQYDISVRECWAYASERFEDPRTPKVQITGIDGCQRKSKLIGKWTKGFDVRNSGATSLVYANMTAFKFPHTDSIYLLCNVELCKGICHDPCQKGEIKEIHEVEERQLLQESQAITVQAKTTAKPKVNCYPGTVDPRCPPDCNNNGVFKDPRCKAPTTPAPRPTTTRKAVPTTTRRVTTPRPTTAAPRVAETTQKVNCYPGAVDPRCPPDCDNNGVFKDPRCKVQTTPAPRPTTTRKVVPSTTPRVTTPRPTTAVPRIAETTPRVNCYPGAVDPRCPPDCESNGVFKDPRCKAPTTPAPRPTTTRRTVPTTQRPTTTRGTTTQRVTTSRPTTAAPRIAETTPKVNCYPGAVDPRCPPDCDSNGVFKDPRCKAPTTPASRPTTTRRTTAQRVTTQRPTTASPRVAETTPRVNCYPGAVDPMCPPDCESGGVFKDPRCKAPTTPAPRPTTTRRTAPTTTQRVTTQRPTTTRGTTTQRLTTPRPTTTRRTTTERVTTPRQTTAAPRVAETTPKVNCYPGAVDPRCPPDCDSDGVFKDPRCKAPTTPTPRPTTTRRTTTQRVTTERPTTTLRTTTQRVTTQSPTTTRRTTTQRVTTQRPTTAAPRVAETTPRVNCYPGAVDPRCPPDCESGGVFKDPRCKAPTTPAPRPTTTRRTGPTTTQRVTTQRPTTTRGTTTQRLTTPRPTTTRKTTTERVTTPRRTTAAPRVAETTPKVNCYPGAVDPRCPPDCDSDGVFKDPRCKAPTTAAPRPTTTRKTAVTTTQRVTTQRPTTTLRTTTQRVTTERPTTTRRTTTQRVTTQRPTTTRRTTTQRVTTERPTTTHRTTTQRVTTPRRTTAAPRVAETTPKVNCYPGAVDPRCPPDCDSDGVFKDPRCKAPTTPAPRPTTTRRTAPTTTQRVTTQRPTTTLRTTTQRVTTERVTTQRPTTTRRTTTQRVTTSRPTTTRRTTTKRVITPRPTTAAPRVAETTPKVNCYPGAVDPRCPPDCDSDGVFKDPRCKAPTTPAPRPTSTRRTAPTTTQRVTTQRPTTTLRTTTQRVTTERVTQRPTTTRRTTTQRVTTSRPTTTRRTTTERVMTPRPTTAAPRVAETTPKVNCYPGAVDPRCPPDCDSNGVFKDRRCIAPTTPALRPTTTRRTAPTTTQRVTTQRPTTVAPRNVETTPKVNCYPGAVDPRCPPDCDSNGVFKDPRCKSPTTPAPKPTTTATPRPTTTRRTVPNTTPRVTTQRPTPAAQRTTETTQKVNCYPGAVDPRCPPDCDNNGVFKDPRCNVQTTPAPTVTTTRRVVPSTTPRGTTARPTTAVPRVAETTPKVKCYPGVVDPRCPPDCDNNGVFKDPRCKMSNPTSLGPSRKVTCYPGAIDPRCPPDCENQDIFKDPRCSR